MMTPATLIPPRPTLPITARPPTMAVGGRGLNNTPLHPTNILRSILPTMAPLLDPKVPTTNMADINLHLILLPGPCNSPTHKALTMVEEAIVGIEVVTNQAEAPSVVALGTHNGPLLSTAVVAASILQREPLNMRLPPASQTAHILRVMHLLRMVLLELPRKWRCLLRMRIRIPRRRNLVMQNLKPQALHPPHLRRISPPDHNLGSRPQARIPPTNSVSPSNLSRPR